MPQGSCCPYCGADVVLQCRCMLSDSKCANGHEWHWCLLHDKIVEGPSDHGKDTMACHCNDKKETERT